MKKIVFILLLILAAAYVAFGQDSLFIGTPQTDTMSGNLLQCYPYQCSVQASRTYIVATAYDGAIDIGGTGTVEVLVMTEDYVHIDTCGQMLPFAGGEFRLLFQFPSACRIIINSLEGDVVTIGGKIDTSVVRPLPSAFIDTDTLCGVLMHQAEPIKPWKWVYFDPFTLEKVTNLQPNKAYLRRKIWD